MYDFNKIRLKHKKTGRGIFTYLTTNIKRKPLHWLARLALKLAS